MQSTFRIALSSLLPKLALAGFLTGLGSQAFAQIPESMSRLVQKPSLHKIHDVELNELAFEATHQFGDLPYLIWLSEDAETAPFARDREAAATWLNEITANLGARGFEARFASNWSWLANEVWTFELYRDGLRFRDAQIDLHWQGDVFIGMRSHVPGPLLEIVETETEPVRGAVYEWYPVRRERGPQAYDLQLARLVTEEVGATLRTTYLASSGQPLSVQFSAVSAGAQSPVGPTQQFSWEEFNVPVGSFPDQIDYDSKGKIWFSQPNDELITKFDPDTQVFSQFSTPGDPPDGLIVDSQDRVWSGLYRLDRGLGQWDIGTSNYTKFVAPYGSALMAIPFETSTGTIFVSDHERNRLSEFDPANTNWLGTWVLPTAGSWIVDGSEDTSTQTLYWTQYASNSLAVKTPGNPPTEVNVTNGGPAFLDVSGGKVYYSQWSKAKLGCYDIATGQLTEYTYPVAGELGGPLDKMPNGDIVVGTRNVGYVFIFHLASQTFSSFKVPTVNGGMKDGLVVDGNGDIWITETVSANKIARLSL